MSLLRTRPKTEARALWGLNALPGFAYYETEGLVTDAATTERALRDDATWACVNVLADAFARTPLDVIRVENGVTVNVATPTLIARPSGITTDDVWRYQLGVSLLTDGNAFGHITRVSARGYPEIIELLNPGQVGQRMVEDGRIRLTVDGVPGEVWPHGNLWHMPGKHVQPGSPFGLSPMGYGSRQAGGSLAAEEFTNRFFSDGGHPTWGFAADQELTEPQADDLKARIKKVLQGGSREPLVYGKGLTPTQFSVQPGQTQFLELMQHHVLQACRRYNVPPSMVFAAVSGQNVTYANVTDADLAWLKHSLDGYFVRLETALTDLLPRPQIVKVNRNAILRADVKARFDVYDVRLKQKSTTVNEVRRLEDEEPFPDPMFDEPGIPGATGLDDEVPTDD